METLVIVISVLALLQGANLFMLLWIRSDINRLFDRTGKQGEQLTILRTEHKRNHPDRGQAGGE